jgi:hypothetical protein
MIDKVTPRAIMGLGFPKFAREIRDPIYNYIHVTEIESSFIDTMEFQRLDRLSQTPTARFVYPNATHTRKAHSLGVMHLAYNAILLLLYKQSVEFQNKVHSLYTEPTRHTRSSILDNLDQDTDRSWWNEKSFPEILQCARLAALLHDLGHGPFSHLFEEACEQITRDDKNFKFDHEDMSIQIISNKLRDNFRRPINLRDIIQLLKKPKKGEPRWFLQEIIDGPYDVDKLDYLNRDSYHAGTREYGAIDTDRIIDGFRVKREKLLISESALEAVISSFNSLQFMYANVYYHKTSRIFDHMFLDAFRLIPDYLREIASDPEILLEYDDMAFILGIKNNALKKSSPSNYKKSWQLIKDILARKKRYKRIDALRIPVGAASANEEELAKIKEECEHKYRGLRLIMDIGRVKGIRIDPLRVYDWLTQPNIVDEADTTNPLKSLVQVSPHHYNSLSSYQLIIYLFIDRKKSSEEYDIRQMLDDLRERIKNFVERERLGRVR